MKVRVVIKGKVHDVRYRPFLLGIAESLEIERFFADNVYVDGKQAVEVLVEDEDEKVKAFVEFVKKKKPENAEVENIDVEEYDGYVMKTESYYRYLTAMQLAKIATYGGKMLQKQDETIRVIREESENIRKELGAKIDSVGKKVEAVGEKVDLLRYDLREYMETHLKKIYAEIAEIKNALKKAGIM